MKRFIETTGKNQEAAIATALETLGLEREQVSIEILEMARSGFLGIGSCPAKVRVTYEVPDPEPEIEVEPEMEIEAKVEPPEEASPAKEEKEEPALSELSETPEPAPAVEAEEIPEVPENPLAEATEANDPDETEHILTFLQGLLERMEAEAEPHVSRDNEGNYQVELTGEHLGAVIGHRGETLDAIQQLTGYAVNRGRLKRVRIRVDAQQYRAKREESLIRMAHKTADRVLRTREKIALEPMNAYERHIIHTALQDRAHIVTYSVGTEPNRRTIVDYYWTKSKKKTNP